MNKKTQKLEDRFDWNFKILLASFMIIFGFISLKSLVFNFPSAAIFIAVSLVYWIELWYRLIKEKIILKTIE